MTRLRALPGAVALLSMACLAGGVSAQGGASGAVGMLVDHYSFDTGIDIGALGSLKSVSQLSIPITFATPIGSKTALTVSTGYARVSLNGTTGSSVAVNGPTDLDARLSFEVVPSRLSAFAIVGLPTGTKSVDSAALPILGVLITDVLSFSTARLGSGGSGGLGLAGAVPVGDLALGWAASYTQFGGFEPVLDSGTEVTPGGELRLRAGLEGPVGPRTYFRVAGIYARRGDDQVGDDSFPQVGNRVSGYVSMEQGVGEGTLTVYAFDAFRSATTIESTAVGLAALPRGNLLALGAQSATPLSPSLSLVSRVELRRTARAVSDDDSALENLGTSFRIGADVTQKFSQTVSLVVEGDALFGSVEPALLLGAGPSGNGVSVRGLRAGAHIAYHW